MVAAVQTKIAICKRCHTALLLIIPKKKYLDEFLLFVTKTDVHKRHVSLIILNFWRNSMQNNYMKLSDCGRKWRRSRLKNSEKTQTCQGFKNKAFS